MQSRAPVPSKRPTSRPLLSKYPGLASMLPFVRSLRPGGYDPPILTLPPETGSLAAPAAQSTQVPARTWLRGRVARRVVALSLCTLGIGRAAFVALRAGRVAPKTDPTRS